MNLPIPRFALIGTVGQVRVAFKRYANGALAIRVSDDEGAYATPSVNLVDEAYLLDQLQFFVKKDAFEADGVMKALTSVGQPAVFELVSGVEVPLGNFGQKASLWQIAAPYRVAVAELAGIELDMPSEAQVDAPASPR